MSPAGPVWVCLAVGLLAGCGCCSASVLLVRTDTGKCDPLREKCTPSVDAYWDGAFVRPRSLNRIGEWWYVLYEGANHYPRQGTEPGTATQAPILHRHTRRHRYSHTPHASLFRLVWPCSEPRGDVCVAVST